MGVKVDSYRDPMSLNTMDDGVPLWRVPKFWSTMDVKVGSYQDLKSLSMTFGVRPPQAPAFRHGDRGG